VDALNDMNSQQKKVEIASGPSWSSTKFLSEAATTAVAKGK
jgi:hypothetical protein